MSLSTKVKALEQELTRNRKTCEQIEACLSLLAEGKDQCYTVKVIVLFEDLPVSKETYKSVLTDAWEALSAESERLASKLEHINNLLENS